MICTSKLIQLNFDNDRKGGINIYEKVDDIRLFLINSILYDNQQGCGSQKFNTPRC